MNTLVYIAVFALGLALLTALFTYTPRSTVTAAYISGMRP